MSAIPSTGGLSPRGPEFPTRSRRDDPATTPEFAMAMMSMIGANATSSWREPDDGGLDGTQETPAGEGAPGGEDPHGASAGASRECSPGTESPEIAGGSSKTSGRDRAEPFTPKDWVERLREVTLPGKPPVAEPAPIAAPRTEGALASPGPLVKPVAVPMPVVPVTGDRDNAPPPPAGVAREPAAAAPIGRAREGDGGGSNGGERRGPTAMLRAARRAGGAPSPFFPISAALRAALASPGTASLSEPRNAGADVSASLETLPGDAAGMKAWEARLSATPRPGEPLALRFEDPSGATGTLRLRVQGDALRATVSTSDPAMATRLERDLDRLQQSLRARGFEQAEVQVARTGSGSGAHDANNDPRSRGERSPRTPQRDPDREGGDPRRAPRDGKEER